MNAIVIHSIPYGDNSRIAHILLANEGLKSFMVRSGKGNRSKNNHLLAPLSLLEIEVHLRENANIHNLTQLNSAYSFVEIPFDPVKSSIALFCGELLHKTLHKDYANAGLFRFIAEAVVALDQADKAANFPMYFLSGLCAQYGFELQRTGLPKIFDMSSGEVFDRLALQPADLSERECVILSELIEAGTSFQEVSANQRDRKNIVDTLISYLRQHLETKFEIRSAGILHEVFS
jgi:DNA repair protein RecO (recombination protein O)